MTDLRDLYQELILDHGRRPRNLRALDEANRSAEGYNPLCGDKVRIHLKMDGDMIEDIGFEGAGCAVSMASASIMTETVKGRTRSDAENLFELFHDLVTGQRQEAGPREAGKLAAFSGVSAYPMRVKCATLPWHTLRAALKKDGGVVTTE